MCKIVHQLTVKMLSLHVTVVKCLNSVGFTNVLLNILQLRFIILRYGQFHIREARGTPYGFSSCSVPALLS